MSKFQPTHLADTTQGSWHGKKPGRIEGFHFDTRRIQAGLCFVALKSESRDGHDFVQHALDAGASCAITKRKVDCELPQLVVADPLTAMAAIASDVRSAFKKPVVAITGSCGKTSTKEMLRILLGENTTHATAGNWNNRIGVPMTLFDLEPGQHNFAVIEAGINQPGEMALLGEMIRADLTILTNIGPAHLELLGSLEGIAEEKSKLADFAKADSPIILPAAALKYPAFSKWARRCIAVSFDDELASPEWREPVNCRIQTTGDASIIELGGQSYELRSSSSGIAQNAALAIVAAQNLGIAPDLIAERIRQWAPESTRGRIVSQGDAYYYIDCYNANPASMIDAIQAFGKSAPAELPRCYVIGAMNELGPAALDFHRSVGEKLTLRPQDRAIFVGPVEMTEAYRAGLKQGGFTPEQIICVENSDEAQSTIADFRGALFLKGSRSYQLESLLPESIVSLND